MKITKEMLQLAKSGDEKAMAVIYERVCYNEKGVSVVKQFYEKYRNSNQRLEFEDVQGDLNEVLWRTIDKLWWKRERNIDLFCPFIWGILRKRMLSRYRKYSGSNLGDESRSKLIKFNHSEDLNKCGHNLKTKYGGNDIEFRVETQDLISKIKLKLIEIEK